MDITSNAVPNPTLIPLRTARAIRRWVLWSGRAAFALMLLLGASSCSFVQVIRSPGVSRLSKSKFQEIAWAPDGATILALSYPAAPGTDNNAYEVGFPTGEVDLIPIAFNEFSHPSWSPSGSQLAIIIGLNGIWLLDPITGTSSYLTEGEAATWSNDGKQLIVYASNLVDRGASERQLRIVALNGTVQLTIPLGKLATEDQSYEYVSGLSLSGDGTLVAYSITIPQSGPNIHEAFIADISSGIVHRFQPSEKIGQMVWAPDGESIAYIRFGTSDYLGELVIADPAGTCLFKPSLPPEIRSISWSPDGSMIAFAFNGDIYVLDLASARLDSQLGEGC
jgi:Tol biopolymer transport system component